MVTLQPPISLPAVVPGEPINMSATLYVTYRRCPDQALGRLRGVYSPESRASFVGGLAHRVFARHLSSGPIAPDAFESVCREEIGSGMNQKLTALGLKPSQLSTVIAEVGEVYDRFKQIAADGFHGAEVFLEVEPAEGVRLIGSVDAVFDDGASGWRLVDWKTGGVGDPGPQLAFYALLWAMERGELPGMVEAVSVGNGERVTEVPSRRGVEETAGEVAGAVDALRTAFAEGEPLLRTAGPWCRWCPLLEECDEGRAAMDLLG